MSQTELSKENYENLVKDAFDKQQQAFQKIVDGLTAHVNDKIDYLNSQIDSAVNKQIKCRIKEIHKLARKLPDDDQIIDSLHN